MKLKHTGSVNAPKLWEASKAVLRGNSDLQHKRHVKKDLKSVA